jgi:predicted membrane-bound spermidine synthase
MSASGRASFVVFVASFCTLVLEIVAGRVLAPYVGVSLYTWTSIIGVVLAGISGGAWAGGRLADRRPAESTLAWLLLASGVAAMLIAPATEILAGEDGLLTAANLAMTLLARVVVLSFLLFFVPSFLLGMISPVAVRLAMRDVATSGTIVGRISAVSTLGSIAGTFVTGFYLVARFGTKATVVGTGAVLIAGSLILFARRAGTAIVGAALVAIAGVSAFLPLPPPQQNRELPPSETGFIHAEESQYYAIRVQRTVREDTGAPIHALHLDHLVHSYSDRADPAFLQYGYLRIFDEVVRASGVSRLLFIGGGGYTLPRKIENENPRMRIDVVEIDPAVTRVAQRFFGLPRTTRIRTINEDARWFTMGDRGPYDVVFIDAFNDLSVPYHLTTQDYARELRRLLAPRGIVAANVIDDFEQGRFLASYIRTLQSVFPHVALVLDSKKMKRDTFVVLASGAPLPSLHAMPDADLRAYLARRNAIVLTDDFAPVDQMMAPLFRARAVD